MEANQRDWRLSLSKKSYFFDHQKILVFREDAMPGDGEKGRLYVWCLSPLESRPEGSVIITMTELWSIYQAYVLLCHDYGSAETVAAKEQKCPGLWRKVERVLLWRIPITYHLLPPNTGRELCVWKDAMRYRANPTSEKRHDVNNLQLITYWRGKMQHSDSKWEEYKGWVSVPCFFWRKGELERHNLSRNYSTYRKYEASHQSLHEEDGVIRSQVYG